MASRLKATEQRWNAFLAKKKIRTASGPTLYGFTSLANSGLWQENWRQAGLEASAFSRPNVMQKGLLRKTFMTREKWIDTAILTKALVTGVEEAIVHANVLSFGFDSVDRRIQSALLETRHRRFTVTSQATVLCAGAGNRELLQMVNDLEIHNCAQERQQFRRSLMLVIKGQKHLPELALVVPDLWLFIVSRRDEQDQVVWLVSHDVDPLCDQTDEQMPSPERVQDNIAALFAVLPQIFTSRNVREMVWGAYTAFKAEAKTTSSGASELAANRTLVPSEWVIERFRTENLFAIWPTKLTLAPVCSQSLTLQLLDQIDPPNLRGQPILPSRLRTKLQIGSEVWTNLAMEDWPSFKARYSIRRPD
jgi:hypothetical protein